MRVTIQIFRNNLLSITILIFGILVSSFSYSQQTIDSTSSNTDTTWETKVKLQGTTTMKQSAADSLLYSMLKSLNTDSSFKKDTTGKRKNQLMNFVPDYINHSSAGKKQAGSFSSRPLIQLGGGYISYNWSYRSGSDSSFIENNISQHLVSGSFNATIAQAIPIRVTYFERQSNSAFFKDFRDVRVDVDVQRYRQMRMQKALANFKNVSENMRDPALAHLMQAADVKLNQYKTLLANPQIIGQLIQSKETVIRQDFADTSAFYRDSAISKATQFIKVYDSLQQYKARYEHLYDSLKTVYQQAERKIKRMEQLLAGKPLSVSELEQLGSLYGKNNKYISKMQQVYGGVRTLSLGRTLPDQSKLTLQNVNVNGFNVEYNKDNLYLAGAGGIVDFRIRDLLYRQQKRVKQYVYSARVGYGTLESDHIILTYFRGRKQLFNGDLQRPAADIQGLSLAAQFYIVKQVKLYGEVAQAGVPYIAGNNFPAKSNAFRFSDNSQRAYAFGFTSNFLRSQTRMQVYYQHTGLNYQSFNSFQYNATTNNWSFRLEQLFWKRQLVLNAGFRKNDFVNPLVLQRYNANTVFKNIILTFRKAKWPILSLGYLPASQYTSVGNQVYENHYQAFNGTLSYQYKVGSTKVNSLVTFNRFFNDSRDSGFVYYNSKNYFLNQSFLFRSFTATMSVSAMINGQYHLVVMEEGLEANLSDKINAGFSIKINHLDDNTTRVGFNAKTKISINHIGDLNLWMEQNYLPSIQKGLYKYEMYNLGLIRYFK